jgi:hypothetical protein
MVETQLTVGEKTAEGGLMHVFFALFTGVCARNESNSLFEYFANPPDRNV